MGSPLIPMMVTRTPPLKIKPSRNATMEQSETPCPERKNVGTVRLRVIVMIRKKHPPVPARVPVEIPLVLRTVCVDLIVVPKILLPTIWRVAIVFSKRTPPIKPSRNAWLEWSETPCPERKNVVTVRWHATVMIRKKHPPVHVRVPVRIHSVLQTVCVETIAVSKVMNLRIPMTVTRTPPLKIKPSRNVWLEWIETPCPELKNVVTVKWHVTVMIRNPL